MFFFDQPKNMNLDVEELQKKVFQDRQRRRVARVLNKNNITEDKESPSEPKAIFKGFAVGIIVSLVIIGMICLIKYKNKITNKIGYCFKQISLNTEKLLLLNVSDSDTINNEEQLNTSLDNEEQAEISQSGIEDLVNRSYRTNVISDFGYGSNFYDSIVRTAKKMNAEGQYSSVITWLRFHENDKGNRSYLFYNELGFAYSREGKHDLAIGKFKKALELNPAYAPSVNGLFTIYTKEEKFAEIKTLIYDYLAKGGLKEKLSQEALLWINKSARIKTYTLNN